MAGPDGVWWRTSSFSGNNGTCVEVAAPSADGVLVRHSKHPDGVRLQFTVGQWRAFVAGGHRGEFDLGGPAPV